MDSPPYFGWVRPSKLGEGRLDFQIERERLTHEQFAEANRLAEFVAWVRPTLIDYLVVDSCYGDVLRLPDQLHDLLRRHPRIVEQTGTFVVKSHVLTEKAVNGFFAAAGAFRDRVLARTGSGKGSELNDFVSQLYDRNPSYRLGYNLRNLGLHRDSIVNVIPMHRDGVEEIETRVELSLSRDRLLDILDINTIVRSDLKSSPDKINLIELCESYMGCLAQLFAKLLASRQEELEFAIHFVALLRGGLRGMPADATPMLFLAAAV